MKKREIIQFDSTHSVLTVENPASGVILLKITGYDIGEFGPEPMRELERLLSDSTPTDLFIDARETKGASIEVSSEWAQWLGKYQSKLRYINMLTGSRYIQMTARFVRNFAGLHDQMRIFTEREAFDQLLELTVGEARMAAGSGTAD